MLLDVHVGITRPDLAPRALASIPTWMTPWKVEGAASVYELRKTGFTLGAASYVTYLDDDDEYTLPIDRIKPYLNGETKGIFTDSVRHLNGVDQSITVQGQGKIFPHNPLVYRRDILNVCWANAHRKWNTDILATCIDVVLRCEAQMLEAWVYLPVIGYRWYWTHGSDSLLIGRSEDLKSVHEYYKNKLLPIPII
jgi:hypothetical protein